jgi:cytochrome c oxidase subunit 2
MSRKSLLVWILIGFLALIISVAPIPVRAASPAERTIKVNAASFEYDPAIIKVNRGDRITLELVSTDVVHGLFIDGYDLEVIAEPGQTSRLTFVANQAGTFRLRCSVTCGDLHPFMIGKLNVGENSLMWRAVGLSLVSVLAGFQLYRQSYIN